MSGDEVDYVIATVREYFQMTRKASTARPAAASKP